MTETRDRIHPDCTCPERDLPAEGVCDFCQQAYREVVAELYATDPAFREEWDRWCPVDSETGQAILRQLECAP